MTLADKLQAAALLVDASFTCELNMNDTFGFACAESVTFNTGDFERMVPLLVKYGRDALTAYAGVKTNRVPMKCRCCHDNDNYKAARHEIEAIKAGDVYFCSAEAL